MKRLAEIDLEDAVARVRFHPTKCWLLALTSGGLEVSVWEWDEAYRFRRLTSFHPAGEAEDPDEWGPPQADAIFHPTRNLIAAARRSGPIELRRLPQSSLASTIADPRIASVLAFSADGELLLAGGWVRPRDRGKDPWEARTYTAVFGAKGQLVGHFDHSDTTLTLHPNGCLLGYVRNDQGLATVRFAALDKDAVQTYRAGFNVNAQVDGLAFSPDGTAVAVIGEEEWLQFEIRDFPTLTRRFRKRYRIPDEEVLPEVFATRQIVFRPDGQAVVYLDRKGVLQELDAHTGEWLSRVEAHDGWAGTIDSRPDLGLFATGGSDGKVRLWAWEGVGPPAPVAPGVTEEFRQSYASSFRFQPTEEA